MSAQFDKTLSVDEIEGMRQQVLKLMGTLNTHKHRVRPHDHRMLNNHLQMVLNTFGNMSNIKLIEKSDPYHSQHSDYSAGTSRASGKKIIYNRDGSTRVIDPAAVHTTGDGWEQQFDQSLLMKPPCFQMPPQSLTSIPKIKEASDWSRTHAL